MIRSDSAAGFEVRYARYLDVLGVPPYYLVYKLLGRSEITGSNLWAYDACWCRSAG